MIAFAATAPSPTAPTPPLPPAVVDAAIVDIGSQSRPIFRSLSITVGYKNVVCTGYVTRETFKWLV